MKLLIDADRLPYAMGGFIGDDGLPLSWPLVAVRVDNNITQQIEATKATSFELFLTSDDKSNYRFECATIKPYKGNRSGDKPFWFETIRRYLVERYHAHVIQGMEADDALGIAQTENTIISSVDKDLDMIPGLHYNELKPERGLYEISETSALHCFYRQLLTGDPVDNIPGLYGVGGKSSLLHQLDSMVEEHHMYSHVKREYEKRFGSYWSMFLWENATLLWIKRERSPEGQREVLSRLEELESHREKSSDLLEFEAV